MNNVEQARKDFASASQKDPQSSTTKWLQAWLDLCTGEKEESITQRLESLADGETGNNIALVCRGVVAWFQGNYEQAAKHLEQAEATDKTSWGIAFWQGMTYAALGWQEEASLALSRSLDLGLPAFYLKTLDRLIAIQPEFYEQHALPLITRAEQLRDEEGKDQAASSSKPINASS